MPYPHPRQAQARVVIHLNTRKLQVWLLARPLEGCTTSGIIPTYRYFPQSFSTIFAGVHFLCSAVNICTQRQTEWVPSNLGLHHVRMITSSPCRPYVFSACQSCHLLLCATPRHALATMHTAPPSVLAIARWVASSPAGDMKAEEASRRIETVFHPWNLRFVSGIVVSILADES